MSYPEEEVAPWREEPTWRLVASLTASVTACVPVLMFSPTLARGLWTLATFTPKVPIRPMGLTGYLAISILAGCFISLPLSLLAWRLSRRPAAESAALVGLLAAMSPGFFLMLFLATVLIRGIELAP